MATDDQPRAAARMKAYIVPAAFVVLLLACALPARSVSAHHRPVCPRAGSRFQPDPRSARCWTHHFFGRGWQARLMLCVAYTESRYELAATNGVNVGPWQVNLSAHPWVNGWKIRRSWRYAAAVSWHLSGYGTDFSAWRPDCGIR